MTTAAKHQQSLVIQREKCRPVQAAVLQKLGVFDYGGTRKPKGLAYKLMGSAFLFKADKCPEFHAAEGLICHVVRFLRTYMGHLNQSLC